MTTLNVQTCDACGQRNRLPDTAPPVGKMVICGRCKTPLDESADTEEDD